MSAQGAKVVVMATLVDATFENVSFFYFCNLFMFSLSFFFDGVKYCSTPTNAVEIRHPTSRGWWRFNLLKKTCRVVLRDSTSTFNILTIHSSNSQITNYSISNPSVSTHCV